MQCKHQYYHKGTDNQKRADITMELKRPSEKEIAKWDGNQKDSALEFIIRCEDIFVAFKNEIKKAIDSKNT